MTLLKTSMVALSALSLSTLSGGIVLAGCIPAHQARAIVQKNNLKGVAQIRGRVPGKMLSVQLCGSGRSATYRVKYRKSGKGGNAISVITIPAK